MLFNTSFNTLLADKVTVTVFEDSDENESTKALTVKI